MIHPNTAYKVWISDVLNPDNRQGGSIQVNGNDIFRVNFVGSIIMKNIAEDKSFASMILDDSSGQIALRCWGGDVDMIDSFNSGEIVQMVGRVAEYNGLIYIRPEIIKPLGSSDDETLHKAFLLKKVGVPVIAKEEWEINPPPVADPKAQPVSQGPPSVVEESVSDVQPVEETISDKPVEESISEDKEDDMSPNPRIQIIKIIETLDGADGADVEEIIKESGMTSDEVQSIMDDLLKNGEVFMLRPGKVKIL